jgi:hypothetical protein
VGRAGERNAEKEKGNRAADSFEPKKWFLTS